MKTIVITIILTVVIPFAINFNAVAQKATTWNGSSWSNGTPDWNRDYITISSGNVSVNQAIKPAGLTIENGASLNITEAGTISAIKFGSSFEVMTGGTFSTDGIFKFRYGAIVNLASGSTVNVMENFINRRFSDNVTIDGQVNVGGDFYNRGYAVMTGTGAITITGSIFDNGTIAPTITLNSGVLPIELYTFDAEVENENIIINWATATEINNDYFEIQRSKDNINFETIALINGAGSSNEIINYSFTDSTPLTGNSFYRLRQVDFDGKSEVFESVKAINQLFQTSSTIYPNPARDGKTNLSIEGLSTEQTVLITIISPSGRVVKRQTLVGNEGGHLINEISFPKERGIYSVMIISNDFKKTERVAVW